ncbi:MAG TPA: 3'-5' exonuclease, partial [Spirochaetia bacterium]|nr:3'-5' exonuclease [Spirochaetia bacterium]
ELAIPRDSLDLYELSNLFSSIKTERANWSEVSDQFRDLYEEYQKHLKVYNAVDFDDLIMLPIVIFEKFPEVLSEYQERFRHIMVDEFQDTSLQQYRLLRLLGREHRNVCVVGDDDQSIYSWRGANYQNIVNFEKDFPERREIKLEQNYRSTKTILDVANSLIAHNTNRKLKELWTGGEGGTAITLSFPEDEAAEAVQIAEAIRSEAMRDGLAYHDFGVLVRTNGLTAAIEEAFLAENIPYSVSGGTSFFQRKEIKDVLAYLRVVANPDDDINFLRIINTPRRGIGRRTLEQIREYADSKGFSLYSALTALRWANDTPLPAKSVEEIGDFLSLIASYREQFMTGRKMAESVTSLIDRVDYWGYLISEYQKNDKIARWKFGNITRFVEMMERWERDPDTISPTLYDFLNRVTLITRDDEDADEKGKVNLMTIHAAKGLEFEVVFLAGVEDRIIPHARAVEEGNIEEERRLFYVAITRAKRRLFLSSCLKRRQLREVMESAPSPFLEELPSGLIKERLPEEELDSGKAVDFLAQIKARLS